MASPNLPVVSKGKGGRGIQSHRKCWAKSCSSDAIHNPYLKFFRFPTKHPERCLQWVKNSGNIFLTIDSSSLSGKALCSMHFASNQFKVFGNVSSNLNPNAIPTIFTEPPLPEVRPDFLKEKPVSVPQVQAGSSLQSSLTPALPKPVSILRPANTQAAPKAISSPQSSLTPALPKPVSILRPANTQAAPKAISILRSSNTVSLSPNFSNLCNVENVSPSPLPVILASSLGEGPSSGYNSFDFSEPTPTAALSPGQKRNASSVLCSVDLNVNSKRRRLDFSSEAPKVLTSTPLPPLITGKLSSLSATPVLSPIVRAPEQRKYQTAQSMFNLAKSEITPRKRRILNENKKLRLRVSRLRKTLTASSGNDKVFNRFANGPVVSQLRKRMKTKEASILFEAQLANQGVKKTAFRWTLEQKTLALALYKSSSKSYSFLRKILNLPSRPTLLALMSRIEFETGQNATYLNHLQNVIKNFSPSERACVLMWDETQIRKSVHYNEGKDCIEGTVNHGDGIYYRDVANKALVFMVRSITKSWKQPVAYYLSEGETPAEKLKDLIVGVIVSLQEIGLDVRASVSDQGGNNRAAIRCLRKQFTPDANRKKRLPLCSRCQQRKRLCKAAKRKFNMHSCVTCRQNAIQPASVLHYRVNSSTNIYHLWDVPHLLKNVRNNFQQHNVHFGNNKVARWHHLIKLKEQDGIGGTFFQITLKLTDQHLKLVRNKDKMKVCYAAQVMSCRVATALKKIHDWSNGREIPGCLDTAEFIYFVDSLFDSFNGSSQKPTGKPLRCNLSANSPHLKFWKEAESKIKIWHFDGARNTCPSVLGWLENISAVQGLWAELQKDLNLEYLNLRNLNQDPLENLFSVLKSNSQNLPTLCQFRGALKTAIITNLRNSGIRGANCSDDGASLLTDLNKLFINSKQASPAEAAEDAASKSIEEEVSPEDEHELKCLTRNLPSSIVKMEQEEPIDLFDVIFPKEPSVQDFITPDRIPPLSPDPRRDKRINAKKTEQQIVTERIADGQRAVQRENEGLFGNRRRVTAYISGFMVKKTLNRINKCSHCKDTLISDQPGDDHDLVVALEHDDKQRLTYACQAVVDLTVASVDIFLKFIHTDFHKPFLKANICEQIIINNGDILNNLGCSEHKLEVHRLLLLYFCRVSIYHQCRLWNREFSKSVLNQKTIGSFTRRGRGKGSKERRRSSRKRQTTSENRAEEENEDDPATLAQLLEEDF
ncbi:DNA transposase [Frankliniella fusca]|uniref:DNA transposase n=1 Tax=Frankliniella fusca TaxID=407009 RepID=A0AAE1I364_9NEOP|nr:DNA transposase [Frankliniella fusca]